MKHEILNDNPRIEIYLADCMEILPTLKDKSVDLVLTDIPFNVSLKYEEYKDNLCLDDYYKECLSWFKAICRIAKRTIIKFPTKHSPIVLYAFTKAIGYLWTVIQSSPNATSHGMFNLNLYTQYAVSIGEGKTPDVDLFVNTFNHISTEHPAEMPIQPIQQLLEWFSDETDIILDPFMGSGTTGVACKKLNRNFIGIEISEKYYELAKTRINGTPNSLFRDVETKPEVTQEEIKL